ncbi:MAG TPA: hypothetical protein EYM65_04460, partial [Dehalococcoidia bacterium]|nr:hypothetical protein [Dehalococcoidia bacterium]
MNTRILTTFFGLTLMLVLGALGALAGLGVFDARPAFAQVTTVEGEVTPSDPGAVSKLTVRFFNDTDLSGGIDDITVILEDDIKVPSVIDPSDVTITATRYSNNVSGGTTGTVVANPLGITVKFTGVPKDEPEITLEIGDMEPSTSETG